MAEALNDDVEPNSNAPISVQVNYPGPRSDVRYPLNIQYCGGQFLLLSILMNYLYAQYILQNALYHLNIANTAQVRA